MITTTIKFNTKGYDGFIDFIKAFAILCVLFGHTFGFLLDKIAYGVWAGMQVPFFVIIQAFHCYRREIALPNLKKICTRVIVPFLGLELLTFFIAFVYGKYDLPTLIQIAKTCGGFGPGSYFPWIYIQIALLLPLFAFVLNKTNRIISLVFLGVICEGSEILCSLIDLPDSVYRLLAVRYVFLIFWGWLWVKEGVKLNYLTISLSILSLLSILYFEYFSVNDEPWFYNTGFLFHRWPCYFYVVYGLTSILKYIWDKINHNRIIIECIKVLASSSYEIYLIQMSLIFLVYHSDLSFLSSFIYLRYILWVIFVWTISILFGIILNKMLSRNKEKK